jgi:hypothetical protein
LSAFQAPTKGGTKVAISKGDRFPPTVKGGSWAADQLIAKSRPPAKKKGRTMPGKQTSKRVAKVASRALRNPKSNKTTKTLARRALSQTPKKRRSRR